MSNRIAKNLDAVDQVKPSKRLVGNDQAKAQDFVLKTQEVAAKEGFRNVSKKWYDKTHPFSYGHEQIAKGRAETEDINATLDEMVPVIGEGDKIGFQYKDGRIFYPTTHALAQVAGRADISTTITGFLEPKMKPNGEVKYHRDRGDAEVLLHILQNGLRPDRMSHEKEYLWRTGKDSQLRAMLTDQYSIVNNDWLLEVFEEAVPGGRLSHWRGDSDTFYGNIFIPDNIREEDDSDYGGMLSVGNSEIGIRKYECIPSLFRACCMNGCIWGQIKGEGLSRPHKGRQLDLVALREEIIKHINAQIPLLSQNIDKFLGLRVMGWDGASIRPLIAQTAKQYGFDKRQATAILNGYRTEVNESVVSRNNLFGLINGITRAAQEFPAATWDKMNRVGGKMMMEITPNRWEGLTKQAKDLSIKETEAAFSEN